MDANDDQPELTKQPKEQQWPDLAEEVVVSSGVKARRQCLILASMAALVTNPAWAGVDDDLQLWTPVTLEDLVCAGRTVAGAWRPKVRALDQSKVLCAIDQ